MDLLSPLRNLRPKTRRKVKVTGLDGLPPDVKVSLQERANHLRLHGRPKGALYEEVGKQVMAQGEAWPKVIEDERLGTTTVPATFEGLLAHVTTWDSLLLDEELHALRNVVDAVVPAGAIEQDMHRRRRLAQKEAEAHLREHHPDSWDDAQGWRV